MKPRIIGAIFIGLLFLILTVPIAGADEGKPIDEIAKEQKQFLNIASQIGNLYNWAVGIGGLVALGVLIYGGLLYSTSAGNPSRQGDAKEWMFGSLIGLSILFGSYMILSIVNPELTKLKDLELIVNEAAESVALSLQVQVQGVSCSTKGRPPQAPAYDDCSGYYNPSSDKSYSSCYGNFADANCDLPNNPATYKYELRKFLREEAKREGVGRDIADHFFEDVIPCEAPGYNPNAVLPNSTCVQEGNCQYGACGLFQDECDCKNPPDCGIVDWRTQVRYGIALFKARGSGYFQCW